MSMLLTVLCATDDKYVPYCGIMLTSLFLNNKDLRVNVYVLIDKPLSIYNKSKFKKLADRYSRKIEFVIIDNSCLSRFPSRGMDYWSIAMYYRLFAADLLPKEIDRILYLDCDIIINGSLESLIDINLDGMAVATVADIFDSSGECQRRLEYPCEYGYFNSGVLLMNLNYWRSHNVKNLCLSYLSEHYESLVANDQDVLNAVLYNRSIRLPLTYNYQIQFLSKYFFELQSDDIQKEIMDTLDSPLIIHYAYRIKPWSIMYYKYPFADKWEYYKRCSLWADKWKTIPSRKPIKSMLKRYLLWPLGIMKADNGFIIGA